MHHSLAGPSSLEPAHMSADARLTELARILAAGVLRMLEQSSSLSSDSGDSSLAILPTRSVSGLRRTKRLGER